MPTLNADVASGAVAALEAKRAGFRACNLFGLSQSSMGSDIAGDDVLRLFAEMADEDELAALAEFYAARSRAYQVVRDVSRRLDEQLSAQVRAFLAQHAEHQGDEVYAFQREPRGGVVSVQVSGIDWLKVYPDGVAQGALLVKPRAHLTETWGFRVLDGRIIVRPDAELY